MNHKLKVFFQDPIFKQGGVIFISSVVVNVLNLIFWLYLVRRLSPSEYGILNSLVSVLMLFCVPVSILQTVVTRYTSKFMAHNLIKETQRLLSFFIKIVSVFLLVVLTILVMGDHAITAFLRIDEKRLVYAVAAGIIFNSFSTISLGALSGLQRFNDVAVNSVVSTGSKLFFGFTFVAFGLKAFGGLLGIVVSVFIGFLLSVYQLPKKLIVFRDITNAVHIDKKEITNYFLPVGLSAFCIFALTNMDIILVKHFFTPLEAGYYSVAQTIGKIVLFVPGAVGVVMFPKVVDFHARNENTKTILNKCLVTVSLLCGTASLLSIFFPGFILKVLTGHDQTLAIDLVKFFAVSMSFFALVNIFALYHLSLHSMKYLYCLAMGTAVQFLGICLFHQSLTHVLSVLTVCSGALFYTGVHLMKGSAHEKH